MLNSKFGPLKYSTIKVIQYSDHRDSCLKMHHIS